MVKNMCASEKYHSIDFFLTFICSQKQHFGTALIKEYIKSNEWQHTYPSYNDLTIFKKEEIKTSLLQASAGLALRDW